MIIVVVVVTILLVFIIVIIIIIIIIIIITIIVVVTIKTTISSNLIDSLHTIFLNRTANSFTGKCPIAKYCYRTPVTGQLNKPIITRVLGFLTNDQQMNSYYE